MIIIVQAQEHFGALFFALFDTFLSFSFLFFLSFFLLQACSVIGVTVTVPVAVASAGSAADAGNTPTVSSLSAHMFPSNRS
jgi:hypothetical protein